MHLLAHNALQCPATGGFPLRIVATATASAAVDSDEHAARNRALLLRMLPRLDWATLMSAAKDLGRDESLPAEAPAGPADDLDESLLLRLQALLLELEIVEGELCSPCGSHRYAIHDGIPNLVVDLSARAGSVASRKHDTVTRSAKVGATAALPSAATDSDAVPIHRLYRRREKVEVCVMQGDAEAGDATLQDEATKLAPSITALAEARQAGQISDVECVCGFLLVYLQERHPKSWLCGPRNGKNTHRLAFDAPPAAVPRKRAAVHTDGDARESASAAGASRLRIEEVPGMSLSEYHRNKLLSGQRPHPSKKQRAESPASSHGDGTQSDAVSSESDVGAQFSPAATSPVPVSLLDLFAGWQLAAVPNYASRALINWAAVKCDDSGLSTSLSFLRPSPTSHLTMHAAGGRYVTLRLAAAAANSTTDLPTPAAGTSSDVVLGVEKALGSVVCARDPFELILHELKLLDVAMGNENKRREWIGLCSALNTPGLGTKLGASYDATWTWDWSRVVSEMAVSQRPEHTLGYMKAKLLAAFTRARDGAESPATSAQGSMVHEAAGGTRHYLSAEEQTAFNSDVWLPLLDSLGLEKGTAVYVAAVRLGSEEYVPDVDIHALRDAFARKGGP